jgi:uncharacterized protein (DUF1810 family)
MFDLTRFKEAQKQGSEGFEEALSEIRAGHKRSHWIWYIFPQLASVRWVDRGLSVMSTAVGAGAVS